MARARDTSNCVQSVALTANKLWKGLSYLPCHWDPKEVIGTLTHLAPWGSLQPETVGDLGEGWLEWALTGLELWHSKSICHQYPMLEYHF